MRVLQDYCSEKVSDLVQYFIRATTVFIHNLAERRGNTADGDVPVVHEAQGVDDGHRHTEDNLVGCKLKRKDSLRLGRFTHEYSIDPYQTLASLQVEMNLRPKLL